MEKKNILVFPGGTEIGLEINKSLNNCKDIELFSANSDVPNHAPYVFRNNSIISSIHLGNGWIDEINSIILDNNIHYVFPAFDDIIVALAENKDKIKAPSITSPLETCLITRSKSMTYNKFDGIIPVPDVYREKSEIKKWPVFLKPDKGQGSMGTSKAHNDTELDYHLAKEAGLIVLEYLPGKEYTIDCFSSRQRGLLFCEGRERVRTRNGISMNCIKAVNPLFWEYAQKINDEMKIYGAWFFQMKESMDGDLKLMEIAPRIGGTMAFNRVRGLNFALLSIYEQDGMNVEVMLNEGRTEIDRALTNRYRHDIKYDRVYTDLDDTLIINNRINPDMMKFLYQCRNENKEIILITKSRVDVSGVLKKYAISENLFKDIIWIDKDEKKIDYMYPDSSIFIDDSFSERKSVAEAYGIPTFDCSMLEMLIDERR